MPVPLAYFGVVLIWSTTPLAIAWSGQAAGFTFGVASRMTLGLMLIFIFAALVREKVVWNRLAVRAYLYGGLGLYAGLILVYWSAQYIPSGWVSLLFGLTPIITAIMASWWLKGELITRARVLGMILGLIGLIIVFGQSLSWGNTAALGVCGILLSSTLHAASSIWVKRTHANVSGISMTAGSLSVATPLFVLTWLLSQPDFSLVMHDLQTAPQFTIVSILYLALFGSVFGFSLYFHVLKHVEATRVALISLMTPILSLILGHLFNNEPLSFDILLGAFFIIFGLAVFELGGKPLPKWIPVRPN